MLILLEVKQHVSVGSVFWLSVFECLVTLDALLKFDNYKMDRMVPTS